MKRIITNGYSVLVPKGTPETYIDLLRTSMNVNDSNACSVIALAILTGKSYHECARILRDYGRVKGEPMRVNQFIDAIKSVLDLIPLESNDKTLLTLEKYVDPNKRYICFIKGHCVAIVGGKVQCFTRGSRSRVLFIFEVV